MILLLLSALITASRAAAYLPPLNRLAMRKPMALNTIVNTSPTGIFTDPAFTFSTNPQRRSTVSAITMMMNRRAMRALWVISCAAGSAIFRCFIKIPQKKITRQDESPPCRTGNLC